MGTYLTVFVNLSTIKMFVNKIAANVVFLIREQMLLEVAKLAANVNFCSYMIVKNRQKYKMSKTISCLVLYHY